MAPRSIFILALLLFFHCNSESNNSLIKISDSHWINPIDSMEYVWIPEGKLIINTEVESKGKRETVETKQMIKNGFWMSKTEVTVSQFQRFINKTGYITEAEKEKNKFTWRNPGFKQSTSHPVVYVSIKDIEMYANWAKCELPNQVQWIYAARANTTTDYYWGDEYNEAHVWYRMNSPTGTRPVGTKLSNPWGLHDMIGNVFEFTALCDYSYQILGSSWARCDCYSSHQQGQLVNVNVGNFSNIKLSECNSQLRIRYSDDAGFRCIIRP